MKRILQIAALCLSLLAGVCAGCADDDIETIHGQKHARGNIVLRIGTESHMQTRTALAGSYNLHHVCQVYAILYEGTGDAATYVCHHDLMWSPKDSTDYSDGVVQEKVFEFAVPSTLQSGKECTLLCVGLDDLSGTTYGLTLDADQTPSFLAKGKTLADAKAVLATGGSMLKSELFAGWESFTYSREEDEDEDDEENTVEVELTRRVAGAYAYLKDIPVKVNGKEVRYIQWVLGNSPTTEIGLARVERTVDSTLPDDFGTGENTATAAKVLDKLDLETIATANASTNLYDIKEDYTTGLGLSEQTLLLSAYLLPMEHGTNGTLAVQLLDESGDLIREFPAQWTKAPTAAGSATNYSIYPNYVYHAGTRSADSDRPASLAGYRIELVVQPWKEVTIETEFPKVPLEATIDYDKNSSSYIYDCINTTDKMTIMPSLLKRGWKLTLVAEDNDGNIDPTSTCDWIYFVKSDGSYTQTLTSSDYTDGTEQAVEITFRLNDYVVKRTYSPLTAEGQAAINSDWRRARIVLETDESSLSSYTSIRQYNAITVYVGYNKTEYPRGFSRYDYGVERDKDGNVTTQGHLGYWGFWTSAFGLVYDSNTDKRTYYDGEFVYSNTNKRDGIWGTDDTPLSDQPIIRYSRQDAFEWKSNGSTFQNVVASNYWYLPAQYELYKFFSDIVVHQPDIETHVYVGTDYVYWSSTVSKDGSISKYYAFCQALEEVGKVFQSEKNDKNSLDTRRLRSNDNNTASANYGYSRRARHFKE